MSQSRWNLRRPDIYAYVERLGVIDDGKRKNSRHNLLSSIVSTVNMENDRDEGRLINGDDLNVDDRSFGEGCQPDGITVYGGRLGLHVLNELNYRFSRFSEPWLTLGRYLLNQESRYVRLMPRDSYQRPMRLRQVKRDPAVFRKYLDGSQMRRLTLELRILLLFLMTEPGHSQKNQATVWKLTQDFIWKSTRQFHQIILLHLYHISQLLILLLLFTIAPGPLKKI